MQFAEMLGVPFSSLEMLMKQHHERDPVVKTSLHEHVSFELEHTQSHTKVAVACLVVVCEVHHDTCAIRIFVPVATNFSGQEYGSD